MSRGIQRERDLVNRLRAQGEFAIRAPASKGEVDVVAIRAYEDYNKRTLPRVRFFEVKSTAAGPYSHFGPKDREALLAEAKKAGAEAYLCWWPPNKQPQFIASVDWP